AERPTGTTYYSIGDSFEGGGFGVEVYNAYKIDTTKTLKADEVALQAGCQIDGSYKIIEFPVKMNQWNHVVMTWDGSRITVYLNGALVQEVETDWAKLTYPANPAAHHFAIGACCTSGTQYYGGNAFIGKLANFNLYTQAMEAHEVLASYQALSTK
ncbi:MAG: LamG domain-containing protein, partial [Clostridia bacterium]|nr:LamG domain-containing protein [Clostridia bacterium]